MSNSDVSGLRAALEREQARADRYEAEFSACKALLIAAQQRAERAEAGRAEAERKVLTLEQTTKGACDLYQAAEQRASEARALALREAADEVLRDLLAPLHVIAARLRALAALPVEPARRQVTEITQEAGTPRAPICPTCRNPVAAANIKRHALLKNCADGDLWLCSDTPAIRAELARSASEPAPQNPPPSPTGDAE